MMSWMAVRASRSHKPHLRLSRAFKGSEEKIPERKQSYPASGSASEQTLSTQVLTNSETIRVSLTRKAFLRNVVVDTGWLLGMSVDDRQDHRQDCWPGNLLNVPNGQPDLPFWNEASRRPASGLDHKSKTHSTISTRLWILRVVLPVVKLTLPRNTVNHIAADVRSRSLPSKSHLHRRHPACTN